MIVLSHGDVPCDATQLAAALRRALADALVLPPRDVVTIEPGAWPGVERLAVDLTGARIDRSRSLPQPGRIAGPPIALQVGRLLVTARPIEVDTARVTVALDATGVTADLGRDAVGNAVLLPRSAADGRFLLELPHADLERLVLLGVRELAERHKIGIQQTELRLTSLGPRSVRMDLSVVAKKMLIKGRIAITGRLDVDDRLVARLSELDATGENTVGSMVVGLIRPHLQKLNGRQIPLASALGELKIRDVQLDVADPLRITASFGQ